MNDPERFNTMVQQIEQSRRQAETQKSLQLAALNDDPFDVEAQKRIEEAIRQENIAANLEAAMEYNPESFARVRYQFISDNKGDFHFESITDFITLLRLLVYTYE
ncbi:hypothetical protein BGW37DRAFT_81645 [Umbelopsis sp. PMI_123]|nr:hypothetical protein BGW37DRAFT_81645 [Umbelopsis sp. PMI_123]